MIKRFLFSYLFIVNNDIQDQPVTRYIVLVIYNIILIIYYVIVIVLWYCMCHKCLVLNIRVHEEVRRGVVCVFRLVMFGNVCVSLGHRAKLCRCVYM